MFYVIVQDLIKKDITPDMMDPHREYVKKLIDQGKMVTAGPFTDRSGGMILIEANNLKTAEKIASEDPAIVSGILKNTIREFDMSYLRQGLIK